MIASLLLLMVTTPAPTVVPISPEVAEEMTVIGQRFRSWRGKAWKRKGAFVCRTTKSSGDKQVDAIRCDAMRYCMAQIDAEVQAELTAATDKAARQRVITAVEPKLASCAEAYNNAAADKLARERAAR